MAMSRVQLYGYVKGADVWLCQGCRCMAMSRVQMYSYVKGAAVWLCQGCSCMAKESNMETKEDKT